MRDHRNCWSSKERRCELAFFQRRKVCLWFNDTGDYSWWPPVSLLLYLPTVFWYQILEFLVLDLSWLCRNFLHFTFWEQTNFFSFVELFCGEHKLQLVSLAHQWTIHNLNKYITTQVNFFIIITRYCGRLHLLTRGQLTLYSPKPQQTVKQWEPFASDNKANAHKMNTISSTYP